MSKYSKCGKDSEARHLTDGLCAVCVKVKAKTVANVPTSNFLNASALTKLPQKQEIGPSDSLSMIGGKRQRELMEEELSHSPKYAQFKENYSESEESKHDYPQKRQKPNAEQWSFSTGVNHRVSVERIIVVSHTDAEAIKQLNAIEKSALSDDFLSVKL
jgi:hypothetical protein